MRFTLELTGFLKHWRVGGGFFYRYDMEGFGTMIRGGAFALGPLWVELSFKAK